MQNKSLSKNAFFNIMYKVLNIIFPVVSMAYVSRILLADGVGKIAAVSNNISYFMILATLGIPTYGVRELSKKRDELYSRDKLFCELFALNFILTIFTYLLFNIVLFSFAYFRKDIVLYEILGLTILFNIINIDWLFQACEEYKYITIRSTIVKVISIILLFLLVKTKEDIFLYAIIQVVATSGNNILNVIKMKFHIKISFKDLKLKKHFKPLIYMALGGFSTELYAKMDITMLDCMSESSVVGYYTNSQKIINLSITALVAATAVFMPRLSYLFEKNKIEFNRILKKGLELMISISIPSCIGLMLTSNLLVSIFLGNDFASASVTVSILSLMIPLKCVGDLVCYQVMMCAGQEALLMKSYFLTMIVNLINNIVLIPKFGAVGASIASVISEIVAFVFVLPYSKKYFEINDIHKVIIKTVICSIAMALTVFAISFTRMSPVLKFLLEGLVGISTFVLSSILFKHTVVLEYIKFMEAGFKNRIIK